MHFTLLWEHNCHAPNLILRIVTMTNMLISSLNLILTITNLTFTKASLFLKKFDKQFQVNIINIVLHLKKKKKKHSKWIMHHWSINILSPHYNLLEGSHKFTCTRKEREGTFIVFIIIIAYQNPCYSWTLTLLPKALNP